MAEGQEGSTRTSFTHFTTIIRPLIPLKVVVFLFYGGIFSLLPFLSVHMQALGLSKQQTAIVYAVILLAAFAGAPIAGYLVDKTGSFKLVLTITVIVTAVLHSCLLLIPPVTTSQRPLPTINFECTTTGAYLTVDACRGLAETDSSTCAIDDITWNLDSVQLTSCKYECPNKTALPKIIDAPVPLYESQICFRKTGLSNSEIIKNKNDDCDSFKLEDLSNSNLTFSNIKQMFNSRFECVHQVWKSHVNGTKYLDVRCPAWHYFCKLTCEVSFTKSEGAERIFTCEENVGDMDVTFYAYFALRLLCMLSLGATYPLIESAILIQTKKHNGEFGKQRMFSHVAQALFPPVVGVLVDQVAKNVTGPSSYFPAFIVFDALMVMTVIVVIYSLSVEMTPQPKLHLSDLRKLLHCWDAVLLYLAVFFLGALWGFLETFLFWFLLDIGSTKLVLGLTRTVGSLVCIPTMFFAETIMNKLGRSNLIGAAFLCYTIQLLCYSFIWDPRWAIAVEILKFFSSCLKVASVITLANSLAPKGLLATTQATTRCLQYEIGSGIGNLIGGSLAATLDMRFAFRILGASSALFGFLYTIGHYALGPRKIRWAGVDDVKPNGKNGKHDAVPTTNPTEEVYPESQV